MVQVTDLIDEPSFMFTETEVLKFITGSAEVVYTVSLEIYGSSMIGAEIDVSITASLFSSQDEINNAVIIIIITAL